MERILDPAVGNGVLLEPFLRRVKGPSFDIFAIDSDLRPLKRLRRKFDSHSGKRISIIQADFLEWASVYRKRKGELFDCVVMNPPFAGRRHRWRSLAGVNKLVGVNSLRAVGPVEAGFVVASIGLLRAKGRLLAILPASLVASSGLAWVREFMATSGAICHVHELPRFAFPEIESRIYLVVYEKGTPQRRTFLLNHDLEQPEQMLLERNGAGPAQRLDFSYHSSAAKMGVLKGRHSFGWQPLGDLATVLRGTERTPGQANSVVHTGNYCSGFWRRVEVRGPGEVVGNDARIRAGDILVKRVSRNCAHSFGLGYGIRGALASDCVLIVRPQYRISSIRLLFAIRCLMALDFSSALLERGTGASYLSQGELEKFEVPYALSREYGQCFSLYVGAIRRRSFASMQQLESMVRAMVTET
jgi:hypothetical protein